MQRMLLFLTILLASTFAYSGVFGPELASKLATLSSQNEFSVIVHFKVQADLTQFRPDQKEEMVAELHRVAEEVQPSFLSRFAGELQDVGRFWIYNGFACTARKDAILELTSQPEVDFVCENETIRLEETPAMEETGINTVAWNLRKVKADSVWRQRGYTGQGVVLGIIDTGVEVTHPALARSWRRQDGWYDPVNHDTLPTDSDGHGTFCMGIAVGCASLDTIGVAIGATWIAARWGNTAQTDSCFQWYARLDSMGRGADVLITTIAVSRNDTHYWMACRNLQLLGTSLAFSVGAVGPGGGTVPAPSNFPCLFGLGVTDVSDVIATFSSRGPSPTGYPWDSSAAWLDPLWGTRTPQNHIKPDLAAPGVNIRSSYRGGIYVTMSGTSWGPPHLAGAIALLKEKSPTLTPAQQWQIITSTCDTFSWGNPYPNQNYGWGRLNCLRAIDATPSGVWAEPFRLSPPASRLLAIPNPFTSFTSVPGHSSDRFALYDISGRRVGVYKGDRIGEGLVPGVYFVRAEGKGKPVRVVKVR
jgi:subtilisin family serine protease